jgi:hypothetical protein
MNRTHAARSAALLLLLAAGFALLAALLMPTPASAATTGTHGRHTHPACSVSAGAVSPDRVWLEQLVGCGTELSPATADHLLTLRNAGCDGLRAGVPVRRILSVFTAELGSRRDAVSLLTDTSVYCYGG